MFKCSVAFVIFTCTLSLSLAGCDQAEPADSNSATAAVAQSEQPSIGPAFGVMVQSPHLFVGELVSTVQGPTAQSYPPIYSFRLGIRVTEAFRGDPATGDEVMLQYSARQTEQPVFNEGEEYVIAAKIGRNGGLEVVWLAMATEDLLAQARLAAVMPLGWRVEDGKLLSPWAWQGASTWPASEGGDGYACSKSGRPALLAGEGVTLTSELVPPAEAIKWTNPDGDGEYTITVTNTTDKPIDVPALLSSAEGEILWNESLVIICQAVARPAPLAEGVPADVTATELAPGQSVSTVVNAFRLKNIEWPRGGYRVEFTFCLGELATTESFYYKSNHHDPIRNALD